MGTRARHVIFAIFIAAVGAACGDAGGSGFDSQRGSAVTVSNLEREFPIRENGSFDGGIQQSFVCIDQADQEYYLLSFDAAGNIRVPDFGITLTYTTTNDVLNIDMTNAYGPGVSYQHAYHMHAGDLVVGFVGNLTDGVNNAAIGCIAAEHEYSDSVPATTTIACRSRSPNNSFEFSEDTTTTFSLEPGHYAQRNFNSFTYSGGGVSILNFPSSRVDHGTYLYDETAGEFVMAFMRVDLDTPDLELLVFEGQVTGDEVMVELGRNSRGCAFE